MANWDHDAGLSVPHWLCGAAAAADDDDDDDDEHLFTVSLGSKVDSQTVRVTGSFIHRQKSTCACITMGRVCHSVDMLKLGKFKSTTTIS